ncbi:alpha/beta hydrolase [Pseudomonas purpurea]|uniref:alpha/beta fold hydrolase n=1 Tax=Pseudomonas purpurea TaxID=3136737 RepID=UPI003264D9D2
MNQPNTFTLVLLPGMDGTGELFLPFITAIGGAFDTLVVDYPTDQPLSYAALETLVRKALPTDRPYIVLGESFSGPIAVSLAASQPAQLKGLVLCSTFVKNPRPVFRKMGLLVNALPLGQAPIRWISRLLLGRFSTAALRSALNQAISRVTPQVMRARLRAVLAVDVSTELTQVSVPALYLRATRDWVVPATASALVLQLNPNVQIADVDAPHCLLQAKPDAAARHISAFARTLKDA